MDPKSDEPGLALEHAISPRLGEVLDTLAGVESCGDERLVPCDE
jgi:hypothetical protein